MAENVTNKNRPQASNKYSLYAGREEAVNWGQVAVNLTKGLEKIKDERAAAKQKIIDDTNAAMTELSEIADVQSGSMNTLLIDGSDFSKNTLQANMDLVRRGLLDPKDYMLIMQQQKDGYKSLSNYAKNYDAKYKEGMARIQDGSASNLEEFFRGTGFSFGNVKNKKLWTDPASGELFLVEMQPDPDNPGKFILPDRATNKEAYSSPSAMVNMIAFQEDSADLNEDVKNIVTNNLAEVVTSTISSYNVLSGGKDVKSIEDFRQLFEDVEGAGFENADGSKMTFDDWMTQQAKGVVGNANKAAEYLMNAGMGYSFTMDETEAANDPLKILAKSDGGPPQITLTDEQMKAAENLAKNQINSQLDSVVKINAGLGGQQERAETTGEINQKNIDKSVNGYLNDLNVVLTDPDLKSAESQLNKLIQQRNEQNIDKGNPVITNVDITDDVILVEFDGREPIKIVRQEYDENNEVAAQTSLQQDIASLYDVLSPFGDREGYDLSTTEVNQRIKDNITLGERGKNRNVGFEEEITPGATDITSSSTGQLPNGTEITLSEYYRDKTTMGEETTLDSISEIEREMNKALQVFFDANMKKNFANAGFTNPKIEVKVERPEGGGRPKEQAFITYKDSEGNTQRMTLGPTVSGTPVEDLAGYTATAINFINEAANKKGGSEGKEQDFVPNYLDWKKMEGNENKTFKDWQAIYG